MDLWENRREYLLDDKFEEFEDLTRENQPGMSSIKVVIPEELKTKFKTLCTSKRITMNDVLAEFIENWVKEQESDRPKERESK